MRTTTFACLLAATVPFVLPAACAADTLTIPGTGSCTAVLRSVAMAYEQSHPMAKVDVPPSVHSEGGIRKILSGEAVLARVSRQLTREEAEKNLAYRAFARDAVVFAVGSGVRARGFTIRQIVDIFSGATERWEELGAGKGDIRVLLREDSDSSLRTLKDRYPGIRNLRFSKRGKVVYTDQDMVDMLQKYRNSVGFATLSALGAGSARVTPVAIDGVSPTTENIAAARYSVLLEYALVYRNGDLPPEAREFVDFVFSPAGRNELTAHGLIPIGK